MLDILLDAEVANSFARLWRSTAWSLALPMTLVLVSRLLLTFLNSEFSWYRTELASLACFLAML